MTDLTPEPGEGIWMYKTRPVPWVVRWSSEKLVPGPRFNAQPSGAHGWQLGYVDEVPSDRIDGVLWQRENDSSGQGEPLWAEVHSHRQRLCMIEGRCQICGRRAADSDLRWVIPVILHRRTRNGVETETAPVCLECRHLAFTFCPFLSTQPVVEYIVSGYRPVSLFGDAFTQQRGRLAHVQMDVPLGSSEIQHLMARQVVVELFDYRRVRT